MRRTLLLLLLLVPMASAQSEATFSVDIPLNFEQAQVILPDQWVEDVSPGANALPCREPGQTLLVPESRFFRFVETQKQSGCAEVRFFVSVPAECHTVNLVFDTMRQVKQATDGAAGYHLAQQVRFLWSDATTTLNVFDPNEGNVGVVEKRLPADRTEPNFHVGFYFEDRGGVSVANRQVPVPGNSLWATVESPRLEASGIPVALQVADTGSSGLGGSLISTKDVTFEVPEHLTQAGDVALHIHMDDGSVPSALVGPDGRRMSLQADQLSGGAGQILIPANLLDAPGTYHLEVTQSLPRASLDAPTMLLLVLAIPFGLAMTAGGVYGRYHRNIREEVPGAWKRSVLGMSLALLGFVGIAVFAGTSTGRDALTLVPPDLSGILTYAALGAISLAFLLLTLRGLHLHRRSVEYKAARDVESMNRELARSNRDLAEFADTVSHDLQAPLRTVVGFTSLLDRRHGKTLAKEAQEYTQLAREGAERMQAMVQGLLQFSQIGQDRVRLKTTSMDAVLRGSLRDLEPKIAATKAKILHDPLPKVHGHSGLLAQLLTNLLDNSMKYCTETPEVHLGVRREGNMWRFAVADNGIGIDDRFQEKVFVMFQRLHGESSAYKGSGIGLSVSRRIVEVHGGTIGLEANPAGGTIVWFTVPAPRDSA